MHAGPDHETTDRPAGMRDALPAHRYTAARAGEIEAKWQERWDKEGTFHTPNPAGALADGFGVVAGRPKLFVMDMFPYPSGAGLHVGHPLGYIGTDVYARYKRMSGYNVLHTMGYDAFGLPAELHAVATGIHPRVNTEANVATMRRQLRRLGLGHDPRRSISTMDPHYYRWTQWIFLQIFNSFFDKEQGRARPVADLVEELDSGRRQPDPGTNPFARPWPALTGAERADVVNNHRLAYVADAPVNWCPGLGTVVSNEEVTNEGRSERGNFPVFTRNMRQWMMRITSYADRLVDDLDGLDWPESVKVMQRNWIGRSTGAMVEFPAGAHNIEVFTTRPDTLFGATFMVLAPEHPLVDAVTGSAWPAGTDARWTGGHPSPADAVAEYRRGAAAKTSIARQEADREKTGVFIGASAVNPVNGEPIPIFIADYVLMGYGTGAIMAVPSGDQRDFEYARAFGLAIVATVHPTEGWFAAHGIESTLDTAEWPCAYVGDGGLVNSVNDTLDLNAMGVDAAKTAINAWLESQGRGRGAITYRLRDWLFSRQRYWGEPFPIVYDEDGRPLALPDSMLPLELPDTDRFTPRTFDPDDGTSNPEAPLDRLPEWKHPSLDLGSGVQRYTRDTNVMPNWAGSCWYYLRYIDPVDDAHVADPLNERYWMSDGGVDLYVGGVEHAVLHLLYSRFWHKVLYDLGHVSSIEPFHRLVNQGYILAESYKDERGVYVDAFSVEVRDDDRYFYEGRPVTREFGKMGKSLKNAVSPDELYADYGADTLRVYEMSMGPFEMSRPWETRAVSGAYRLLQRVWRLVVDEDTGAGRVSDVEPDEDTLRVLHRTIAAVREAVDALRINTPIAKITELVNHLTASYPGGAPRSVADPLVRLLAPYAPHIAEELWERLGYADSLTWAAFPHADPAWLVSDTAEVVVQINGKVRGKVVLPATADAEAMEAAARAEPRLAALLTGALVRRVIVVPGRLVNFVLG